MLDASASSLFDGYVIGAYAASPAHRRWDPVLEGAFLRGLADIPAVSALELPWTGRLHPHDDAWLLDHLPQRFEAVLTDIPHTVARVAADPDFGLASPSARGRRAAIDEAARMRDDARRLNDARGNARVRVVELHAAPRGDRASRTALVESLREISDWEWDGARLVLEHCDAWVPGQQPEKGYLALTDERDAILDSGTDIGLSINWGRSAIELRDAGAVVDHIRTAADAGLLRGFMASGASDRDSAFGPAWTDAHLPMRRSAADPFGEPTSLLDERHLVAALGAARDSAWSGLKMGWAGVEAAVPDRVAMVRAAIRTFRRCQLQARPASPPRLSAPLIDRAPY